MNTTLHINKIILLSNVLLCFQLYPMKPTVKKRALRATRAIISPTTCKLIPGLPDGISHKIICRHTQTAHPWENFDRLLTLKTVRKSWNTLIGTQQKIARMFLSIPPMHYAAMTNNVQKIFALKSQGYSISKPDIRGLTPLDYALACNKEKSIEILCLGAHDNNFKKNNREYISTDNTTLKRLLSIKKTPYTTYILEDLKNAIDNKDYKKTINILLRRGDLAVKCLFNERVQETNDSFDDLIRYRIETYAENYLFTHIYGSKETFCHDMYFDLFKDAYANPNTCDKYGNYFLHYLCLPERENLYPLLIKFLKLKTINVNVEAPLKVTPLHLAAENGYFNALKSLLQTNRCYLNPKDSEGYSPICYSVSNGHHECTNTLIKYGADAAIILPDNTSLLHIAAENGHCETIQLLLRYGADKTLKTTTGETALDLAQECGHEEAVKLLL